MESDNNSELPEQDEQVEGLDSQPEEDRGLSRWEFVKDPRFIAASAGVILCTVMAEAHIAGFLSSQINPDQANNFRVSNFLSMSL